MENTIKALLCIISVLSYINSSNGSPSILDNYKDFVRRTENLHDLLSLEISTIKTKVWVELNGEIQAIRDDIAVMRLDLNKYLVTRNNSNQVSYQSKCECSMQNDRSGTLVTALREEKVITRNIRRRMTVMQKVIDSLLEEMFMIRAVQNKTTKKVKSNHDNLTSCREDIDDIDADRNKNKELLNWIKSYKQEITRVRSFKRPTFISDWFLMKSQDETLSDIVIKHDLGVLPNKVDVLIKPTDGPNAGWTFHGDSAFLNDDDIKFMYGGVVYFYNETHVRLFAPRKNNQVASGRILYTGAQDERRLGDHHQTAESALVRVKVWGPKDMPPPDFETDWLPLDISDSSKSFYEIEHQLGDYPALINLQVYNKEARLTSEGVGSSVKFRPWLNAGGTVWGFSNESVRIWSAFMHNLSEENTFYRPIGGGDGWGKRFIAQLQSNTATFRVLAWSESSVESNQNYFIGKENPAFFQSKPVDNEYKPTDYDLFSIFIEATSGPNNGFRFKGYGSSQSKEEGFGGSVFAYGVNGDIRSWPPNPKKNGHLIHINSPYGNGKNIQITDDAVYVYSLVKTWPRQE